MGLLGSKMGSDAASDANAASIALAREMAQNNISWKVKDAKKAGIHPLYALGASSSISPTLSSGGADAISSGFQQAGNAIAAGIDKAAQKKTQALQNEFLESQIRRQEAETRNTILEGQKLENNLNSRSGALQEIVVPTEKYDKKIRNALSRFKAETGRDVDEFGRPFPAARSVSVRGDQWDYIHTDNIGDSEVAALAATPAIIRKGRGDSLKKIDMSKLPKKRRYAARLGKSGVGRRRSRRNRGK